ncbi:MAG: carboxypeptidase-like regulatory domain-containing protein [Planctomycetota bacterium]|nr:carboxypeptidase-like regulatory domain-containing protein [Planctomycetota bacterium]
MKRTPLLLALALVLAILLLGDRLAADPPAVDSAGVVRAGDQDRIEEALSSGTNLDEERALVDVPTTTDEGAPEPLVLAGGTGGLRIRVVTAAQEPVPDAELILSPHRGPRLGHGAHVVRTDAEGQALVVDLPPGRTTVTCTLGQRESAEVEVGVEVEVTLVLENVIAVTGRVEGPDGHAVPFAQVWIASWGKSWRRTRPLVVADADGRFVAAHVGKERSLGATAPHHGPSELIDMEHTDLTEVPVDIVLTLGAEGGAIEGVVVDPEGLPVPGALVAVGLAPDGYSMRNDGTMEEYWSPRSQYTDERGRFREEGVPTGTIPVHVFVPSAPECRADVEVRASQTTQVTLELEEGMVVTGVVTDAEEHPLAGALVIALDAPFVDPFPSQGPTEVGHPFHRPAVRTGADGTYELDRLPSGEVHLYSAKGTSFWDEPGEFLGTAQETLAGTTGETLTWNPVLDRGQRIFGRVVYADGSEMGSVFVSATDSDDRSYTEDSDEHGVFSITGLEDRPYKVSVQLWDPPEGSLPLEQESVWASEVELILTASYSASAEEEGTVRVRIDDRANRVSGRGSVVYAFERGWRHCEGKDGVFEASMKPGRYQARVMQGETVVGASDWFDLGPGDELDLGTVVTRGAGTILVTVKRPAELADRKAHVSVKTDTAMNSGGRPLDEHDQRRFEDLLEGLATVGLSGEGVAIQTRKVQVKADATLEVIFELGPATKVNIEVTAAVTEGFGKLQIEVIDSAGELYTTLNYHERWGVKLPTQAHTLMPVGAYELRATTTNGQAGTSTLTVEDGSLTTAVIHLK